MPLKTCPCCDHIWPDLATFLADPDLHLVGYQVNFENLAAGFFLFNHACRTTLAMSVESIPGLGTGRVFSERRTGSDSCPGHCLNRDVLAPCPVRCECAYVRDVMQEILEHPRAASAS